MSLQSLVTTSAKWLFPLVCQRSSLHLTAINQAAPLRKKKVVNPLTTKKQFERKVRRLEKEINRLESIPPKLKPILELQLPPHVVRNLDEYKRKDHQDETCHKLIRQYYKVWAIYKGLETAEEIKCIRRVTEAQQKAMDLLKNEYPNLYDKAIQIDPDLIPYKVENVKKNTPPNESYSCPDGRESDITKEWKL